jgi:hypothetical protein
VHDSRSAHGFPISSPARLLPQRTKAKNKRTDLREADAAKTLLKVMNKFSEQLILREELNAGMEQALDRVVARFVRSS